MLRIAFFLVLLCPAQNECLYSQSSQKENSSDKAEVFTVGGDVKPPKLVHYVEPESSSSSKEAYVEGVVRISTIVNVDGTPSDLHVTKGLNDDEDHLALEALQQWRFQPGTRKGQAVRVRINVEIEFHLL